MIHFLLYKKAKSESVGCYFNTNNFVLTYVFCNVYSLEAIFIQKWFVIYKTTQFSTEFNIEFAEYSIFSDIV